MFFLKFVFHTFTPVIYKLTRNVGYNSQMICVSVRGSKMKRFIVLQEVMIVDDFMVSNHRKERRRAVPSVKTFQERPQTIPGTKVSARVRRMQTIQI